MSEGQTRYIETFPDAKTIYIKPKDLIKWLMKMTGVHKIHYNNIIRIAEFLENSSEILQRSSPQSVASAIIYFYLCLNKEYKDQLNMSKNKFANKALLSDITITKLTKEMAAVSKETIVI